MRSPNPSAQPPAAQPSTSPTRLTAKQITSEAFQPFGQVIFPSADGAEFGPNDAQLDISQGIPRLYIMHLEHKGRHFSCITRHQACTQCLGSLHGQEWFMAVAPASDGNSPLPDAIQAFRIPGNCFIKLHRETWHAGPYFDQAAIDFYNLELSNTNVVDHYTCDLNVTFGLSFEII